MQSHTILPPIKFLLDSPNHDGNNVAAVSVSPHSNRQSFSSASSSPISTSPPITPLSSSFRLPSMSHQNKQPMTIANAMNLYGNGQTQVNIGSLLSPPKSPEASPSYFEQYGTQMVRQEQQLRRYAMPQPSYNAYPVYATTIKPSPTYSPIMTHYHQPQEQYHRYFNQHQQLSYQLQSVQLTQFDQFRNASAAAKRMAAPKSMIDDQSSTSSNTNRYQCPYCSKRFSRPSSLRIHTYSHTGEKPFMCTEPGCGRKFSVQSNMRRHLRVHRLGRPVKKMRYDGEVEGVKVHMNPAAVLRTC
ncbi:11185_t:CDS:2 [Ambispora leptoticha]|uniref:11185_t:CDS:1 n=1 Tax=Ambispora leptoticha TaxID=144679 RepID=A0A9N8Z0Y1_9GLOM|nr:11185_t:CDS:2 [Ambispora leptoticha]